MAQVSITCAPTAVQCYHQALVDAHKLVKKSVDRWVKGNPEDPSAEEVLRQILNIFLERKRFHRLSRDFQRSWQSWNGGTIPKFAKAMNDEGTFENLPILADALEEAGCTNANLLTHCRQPGHPGRRCSVVELLLGREVSSLCFLPRQGTFREGMNALASEVSEGQEDRYDLPVEEAFWVLTDAVVAWVEGDPEDPPTEQVLKQILAIFVESKLLRLPSGVGSP